MKTLMAAIKGALDNYEMPDRNEEGWVAKYPKV